MLIAGLQKMSLLDYPGRVACTVFTGGCNLRCVYCHNSELLVNPPAAMTEEGFFAFLRKRKGLIDGVCVTGGEPCIHGDLPEFLGKIRSYGFAVKLDTNGCFPDMLERILREGLADYAAVDVKNGPEELPATAGLPAPKTFPTENFLRSVRLLLASDTPFELRTTCVVPLHTRESVEGIRGMLLPLVRESGRLVPRYYLQAFADRDTVLYAGLSAPGAEKMEEFREILSPLAERVLIRGEG